MSARTQFRTVVSYGSFVRPLSARTPPPFSRVQKAQPLIFPAPPARGPRVPFPIERLGGFFQFEKPPARLPSRAGWFFKTPASPPLLTPRARPLKMPDHSAAIANLEAQIDTALTSVTTDGTTHRFDLDAARRRLAELKAEHDGDAGTSATPRRRQRLVPYRFS